MSQQLFKVWQVKKDAMETRFVENMITMGRLLKKYSLHELTEILEKDYEITYEATSNLTVNEQLNHLFDLLNRDNRPTGQISYSLSVGDIIEVDQMYYMVDTFGFYPFKA